MKKLEFINNVSTFVHVVLLKSIKLYLLMKTIRLLLSLIAMLSGMGMLKAQDVLITKEGDALKVWNVEVSGSAVFYQESMDENASFKRMNKSDLLMIKYKDGKKVIIGDEDKSVGENASNQVSAAAPSELPAFGVNPNLEEDNLKLVREFNSRALRYIGDDAGKNATDVVCALGLKEGSIIETPELKASFSMKRYYAPKNKKMKEELLDMWDKSPVMYIIKRDTKFEVTLKNKTNKPIYVDLANSFVIDKNDVSTPYYVPTATTISSSSSSGVGVNMGAIAGALGVGGAVGTLASGVNVGGGNTVGQSTTTYNQRIIIIPPMASISLPAMSIGEGYEEVGITVTTRNEFCEAHIPYFYKSGIVDTSGKKNKIRDFVRGEIVDLPTDADFNPLSTHITYSFREDMSQTNSMRMSFYLRQMMGYLDSASGPIRRDDIDYTKCPLIFQVSLYRLSKLLK